MNRNRTKREKVGKIRRVMRKRDKETNRKREKVTKEQTGKETKRISKYTMKKEELDFNLKEIL